MRAIVCLVNVFLFLSTLCAKPFLTSDPASVGDVIEQLRLRGVDPELNIWLVDNSELIKDTYAQVAAQDKFKGCNPVVQFLAALAAITTRESMSLYELITNDFYRKGDLLSSCFGYVWGTQAGNETEQAVYNLGQKMVKSMTITAGLKLNNDAADAPVVWSHVWHIWQTKQRQDNLWDALWKGASLTFDDSKPSAELNPRSNCLPDISERKFIDVRTSSGSRSNEFQSGKLTPSGKIKLLIALIDVLSSGKVNSTPKGVPSGVYYALVGQDPAVHTVWLDRAGLFGSVCSEDNDDEILRNLGVPKNGAYHKYSFSWPDTTNYPKPKPGVVCAYPKKPKGEGW